MKEEHKHKHEPGPAAKGEAKQSEHQPAGEEKKVKEPPAEQKVPEAEIKLLTEELIKAKAEARDNKDKALRAMAEQSNASKRQQKEKEEFIKYASAEIARKLLPVLDDFENALKGSINTEDNFVKGVKMIYGNLKEVLEKEGLKKQDTAGRVFDPHLHEVVATEPTGDAKKENVVAVEFRPGYMFKEFVLRPAMVKVFKKTDEEIKEEKPKEDKAADQKIEEKEEDN